MNNYKKFKAKKVKVVDFYPVEKTEVNEGSYFFFYDYEILDGAKINVGDELSVYNDETQMSWNCLLDKKAGEKNYVYIY